MQISEDIEAFFVYFFADICQTVTLLVFGIKKSPRDAVPQGRYVYSGFAVLNLKTSATSEMVT